ncbi:hypothetical protein IMCC3317_31640 [Kordia antarctica]|uniref:Uncharacterized protein n=1 Tax=Kordia antarctica TaxID=1218801 RepID=A0A7L4ZMA4_9FLAO|nr:hypothetical protein IMCC3317_31640 [Kordia antarctica]
MTHDKDTYKTVYIISQNALYRTISRRNFKNLNLENLKTFKCQFSPYHLNKINDFDSKPSSKFTFTYKKYTFIEGLVVVV